MLNIDLYTEITCPWCIVGQYRLDKVLKERFSDLKVKIRHHPVLLVADMPVDGLYLPDLLFKRYGIADVSQAFAGPEAEARKSGLALDLSRQLYTYPTQAAHALILAARGLGTQHELAVAITEAYFLAASNIADVSVLADIAVIFGFDRDKAIAIASDPEMRIAVQQESAKASGAGIRSVPHFVFGNVISINGGRDEEEIAEAISKSI